MREWRDDRHAASTKIKRWRRPRDKEEKCSQRLLCFRRSRPDCREPQQGRRRALQLWKGCSTDKEPPPITSPHLPMSTPLTSGTSRGQVSDSLAWKQTKSLWEGHSSEHSWAHLSRAWGLIPTSPGLRQGCVLSLIQAIGLRSAAPQPHSAPAGPQCCGGSCSEVGLGRTYEGTMDPVLEDPAFPLPQGCKASTQTSHPPSSCRVLSLQYSGHRMWLVRRVLLCCFSKRVLTIMAAAVRAHFSPVLCQQWD